MRANTMNTITIIIIIMVGMVTAIGTGMGMEGAMDEAMVGVMGMRISSARTARKSHLRSAFSRCRTPAYRKAQCELT